MSEIIRLSLDTEFNEKVKFDNFASVDFISIGLVDIDQKSMGFYAVSSEFNREAAQSNPFVKDHVLPKLYRGEPSKVRAQTVSEISKNLIFYLSTVKQNRLDATKIEFWAKNGSYDNFILCRLLDGMQDLYGMMNGLGVKKTYFRDLDELAFSNLPMDTKPKIDEDLAHNSFYDACYQAEIIRWVEANQRPLCTENLTMTAALKRGLVR